MNSTQWHAAFLAVLLLLVSTSVFAADNAPVPSDDLVYCSTCHGVQLMGNSSLKAPRLSGMETWYVEQQLEAFSRHWRGTHETDVKGTEMRPMAEALSADQVSAAARYVNATQSMQPAPTINGDANNGKRLYGTCSACHGVSGEGNEALGSPALTETNDWYLVTQLQNFKNGNRGSHSADSYGMQMRAAAQLLPDDDAIIDVVTYITTLNKDLE